MRVVSTTSMKFMRLAALSVALGLALTACPGGDGEKGGGGGSGASSEATLGRRDAVIAREGIFGGLSITDTQAGKYRLEVLGLERRGEFTQLRVAVNYLDEGDEGANLSFGGYRLLDPVGRKLYESMAHYELGTYELYFTKGVRYESDIWFPALPPAVERVSVLTPGSTSELPGVTVTDGPAAPPQGAARPGPTATGTADPTPGQTKVYAVEQPAPGTEPVIKDLYDQIDGEAGTSTTGGGTQTEDLRSDVLFAFDSDRLSGRAQGILDKIAQDMAQRADTTQPVTIEGHTDGKGTPGYNQDLSERRARAVQAAIAPRLGQVRFEVSGKGSDEPLAEETKDGADDPEARARNRRVEISYGLKAGAPGAAGGSPGGAGGAGRPAEFRSAPGGVVAERKANGRNSIGEPVPFRLRVHPFYRDGAFLVGVVEVTSDAEDIQPAAFGGEGIFGGQGVNGFSVTDGSGKTYLPVLTAPQGSDEEGTYVGSGVQYWRPKTPYRSYVYLTAPPAGTKTVTLNAVSFGKIPDVPVFGG
ncbi:OmpA family protein [Actinomadura sp. KC345]|uniref:OmpA family protein n=1 Tax=Actinomadura sp. KC345 TaxID=2530371 RepID=UPI0010434D77|nr:OmpA family protein [Actinomadura sp. KC345]TDC50419.1 OmpA family protein [Actinomadura sp. KC345]